MSDELYKLIHVSLVSQHRIAEIPDSFIGQYVIVLYCLTGQSTELEIGSIKTIRWSEGFPFLFSSFWIGGLVTGSW